MRPFGRDQSSLLATAIAAAALLFALVLPAGAGAAKPIKGKLTKRGYTVIALAKSGKAKVKRAPKGKFKLRPPARKVSLHLRAPDGTYAGPIVLGVAKKGKRALLGATARKAVNLGKVKVRGAKGCAKLKRRATKKLRRRRQLDRRREAKARKGVPIGAGNLGRVRVRRVKDRVPGDLDRDGIADPLDVDDDGDLALDEIDRKPRKGNKAGAAAQGSQEGNDFSLTAWTDLFLGGGDIVNANAAGVDSADVEAALQGEGRLVITPGYPPPVGSSYVSGELDCGGLTYCSAGGTGRHEAVQFDPNPEPFPACCDADADGRGSFDLGPYPPNGPLGPPVPIGAGQLGLGLQHNATSDQIAAGDVLIAETVTNAGKPVLATTLQTIFATVPALASYTDELGVTHELSYPLGGTALPTVDGPDPDSHVDVTLNFWRPQRAPIPDEVPPGGADWIDVGGLSYLAAPSVDSVGGFCPASSYSESDPNLSLGTLPADVPTAALIDSATDQAASPAHTFTYTLDLSDCLDALGASFDPGETAETAFYAYVAPSQDRPSNDVAGIVAFERVP